MKGQREALLANWLVPNVSQTRETLCAGQSSAAFVHDTRAEAAPELSVSSTPRACAAALSI